MILFQILLLCSIPFITKIKSVCSEASLSTHLLCFKVSKYCKIASHILLIIVLWPLSVFYKDWNDLTAYFDVLWVFLQAFCENVFQILGRIKKIYFYLFYRLKNQFMQRAKLIRMLNIYFYCYVLWKLFLLMTYSMNQWINSLMFNYK